MRCFSTFLFILVYIGNVAAQSHDMSDWVNFGDDHKNKWLQFASAKMGPNALPVPLMDYARVGRENRIEMAVHSQIMSGDTAFSSYLNIYWVVVKGRVAVEFWGNPSETFHMTDEVREERQIYEDDPGWVTQQGDLWISTYIQLLNDKKYLPGLTLNYSLKTTTGLIDHGRYTDAPINYFYLAAGKSFFPKALFFDEIRVAGLYGFYVWQTNKVEVAQDEGAVYEAGLELRKKTFVLYNEIGGYNGYDAYAFLGVTGGNDPLVYRARIEKTGRRFDWKLEYQAGLRDYGYTTFKLGVICHF